MGFTGKPERPAGTGIGLHNSPVSALTCVSRLGSSIVTLTTWQFNAGSHHADLRRGLSDFPAIRRGVALRRFPVYLRGLSG